MKEKKVYHRTHKQARYKELKTFVDSVKKDIQLRRKAAGMQPSEDMGFLGCYRFELLNVETGEKEVSFHHNVIPIVGRTMIANNLTDPTPDNTMLITHAALGSNAAAPVEANTQLGTETYRNAIASRTNAANIAYATAFFNQTETTGTYNEAGIFSNGTGSANSGVLLSHVAVSITKTNVQKLTIDWTLTLTSV